MHFPPPPPEFLHTYLPYFYYPSLFPCLHFIQSPAQLCRKQVSPDLLCGVPINGLGGKVHLGTHEHAQPPPSSLLFLPAENERSPDVLDTRTVTAHSGLDLLSVRLPSSHAWAVRKEHQIPKDQVS